MKISRREFVAGLGGAALAPAGVLRAAKTGKPNVLFIAVDDLRPQLGCYGHQQMISPNLDALAASGVLFERAYCNMPVCGASRASLLTGLRPTRKRFLSYLTRADVDAPGVLSLPGHFQKNGYTTISNGKISHHAPDNAGAWSEKPWRGREVPGMTYTHKTVGRGYLLLANQAIARKNAKGSGPAYECADVPDSAYSDGRVADKTIYDLRRLQKAGKPFFLAAGFYKPHLPFNAPKKYWDLYPPSQIDLADNPFAPKDAPKESLHNSGELRSYHGIPPKGRLPDDLARKLIRGYYACTSYTDAQIGRVLTELDRLGLADNTIVILWGDHGWNLGEHGLWCKHCNYRTSLRVPMIVRAPGVTGGKTTGNLAEYVDIYPTLCDLAGLPLPSHLEGTSFVPILHKPDQAWKSAVFSRFGNGESIKTDRYCYTEYRNRKTGQFLARMLYDHKTDLQENTNLSERPEHAKLVADLARRLKAGWKGALPEIDYRP